MTEPKRRRRKSAQIHVLPWVERRDIAAHIPSRLVLKAAIEADVRDVFILGRAPDGSVYMAGEDGDADRVVGKLMAAMIRLASAEIVHE